MQDTTWAHITRWTEHKTPSGRWSATRHAEESEDFAPHELSNFLGVHFPGERRHMSYHKQGYLPNRISVPCPDKQTRHVYTIEYYDGPREIATYTYKN